MFAYCLSLFLLNDQICSFWQILAPYLTFDFSGNVKTVSDYNNHTEPAESLNQSLNLHCPHPIWVSGCKCLWVFSGTSRAPGRAVCRKRRGQLWSGRRWVALLPREQMPRVIAAACHDLPLFSQRALSRAPPQPWECPCLLCPLRGGRGRAGGIKRSGQ